MVCGRRGHKKETGSFKFVRQILSMVQLKLVLGREKESCSFEFSRMANDNNDEETI